MSRVALSWFACALLSLTYHAGATEPVCREKLSACSCMTDQGLIDLSPLDNLAPNPPRFNNVNNPVNQDTYFFNPCSPFSMGSSGGCRNVSVCQGFPRTNSNEFWNFGEHSTATFQNDAHTQQLQIKYKTTTSPQRTTTVTLVCDKLAAVGVGQLSFMAENPENNAIFTLSSQHACPHFNANPSTLTSTQLRRSSTTHATASSTKTHANATSPRPPIVDDSDRWTSDEYQVSPTQLVVAGAVAAAFTLVILQCAWMCIVRRARRARVATSADGKTRIILRKVALWTVVNAVADSPKNKF